MLSLCFPVFMATKKAKNNVKSKKTKKSTKKSSKAKGKNSDSESTTNDIGIVVIEEDIKVDKNAELEARKAYLEEARSQETSD